MRRPAILGLALIGLSLVGLAACGPSADTLVDFRLYVMGTSVDMSLPGRAAREHPDLLGSIEAELRQFESDYYPWADGELARLNAALTAGRAFTASVPMAALLVRAREIAMLSDGAFEPGVGPLVELWGFNDGLAAPPEPLPDADTIAATLAAAGSIRALRIDGRRISAPAGRYLLDLGGIAKGAAVDRVVARLEAAGIDRAIVNAGGDLRVIGEPAERDWRIGIQAPRDEGLLGSVTLGAGEAAFSSGDYERFYEADGRRFHHILDPRTGWPVAHTRAITVIAADGTTADAAATALFVAGPADWQALAATLGVAAALRVDADGRLEMTPAMRDRFQPGSAAPSYIIAAGN
jgi:thiamine biosynthesis lipoprotein